MIAGKMHITHLSKAGKKALEGYYGALIGLSIRNSYFKEENISELITWATENFTSVFIMCPDVPAIDTLRSIGYPENKARQKAQAASNNLENKCRKISENLGVLNKISFIRWNMLEHNEEYEKTYHELNLLYQTDHLFKTDVRSTTKEVITTHGTTLPLENAIDIGINFILKELAFIANSANILHVPLCAYIYHKAMPVHEKMLNDAYAFTAPENSGYIICEIEQSNS